MARLALLDTETTGLDPRKHRVWEVCIILRDTGDIYGDTEHLFAWLPDASPISADQFEETSEELGVTWHEYYGKGRVKTAPQVDPTALSVNRFIDRTEHLDAEGPGEAEYAPTIWRLLQGAVVVASNPHFDMAFLAAMFARQGLSRDPWRYRPIDVCDFVVGQLHGSGRFTEPPDRVDPPTPPWSTSEVARLAGLDIDHYDRHTAAGDAHLVRDLFDLVAQGA